LQNPSFFYHFKIRFDSTKHIGLNNEYLTPGLGGQFAPAKSGQGHWLYQVEIEFPVSSELIHNWEVPLLVKVHLPD
jgi:hypothetical protein